MNRPIVSPANSPSIILSDADMTRRVGAALGRALLSMSLEAPLVIALIGDLGAGKTTLVSGLMQAVGISGPVRSPTYTLIEPYELLGQRKQDVPRQLFHLDLYRLTDPGQLDDLGIRDLLMPGHVLLVEWPERGGETFAHPGLTLALDYRFDAHTGAEQGRLLTVRVGHESLQALADKLVI